jgi:hypothetical protein
MKRVGLAIPGYALDKNDRLIRSTRKLSVSKKIAMRKSKRVTPKVRQEVARLDRDRMRKAVVAPLLAPAAMCCA